MSDSDVVGARFQPSPHSVPEARHLVCDTLRRWGRSSLTDAAALCTSELVANAVLHGRAPFDLVVHRVDALVRIDVIDDRPGEVPVQVPLEGTAADITREASTGRGLQLIAATAVRWGYTTSEHDKSVWVEVGDGPPRSPTAPVVAGTRPTSEHGVRLDLRSMPVRPAVASGMQVEGLVRLLQLDGAHASEQALPELHRLLDVTAAPRLGGRLAALRAAGRHEQRFDLLLDVPVAALTALAQLNRLLDQLAGAHASAAISDDVVAYRTWLQEETARQLGGEPPTPCPLP